MPTGEFTNQNRIETHTDISASGIESRKIATGESDAINSHR